MRLVGWSRSALLIGDDDATIDDGEDGTPLPLLCWDDTARLAVIAVGE